MLHQDVPEGLPESPLRIIYTWPSEVAYLYELFEERRMQRLFDSCSAKEWNDMRGKPPSEWTDQEWALYVWPDWFRDWDYYEPRTGATTHLRNDDPRVQEIGIDHELEAEHEAAIDRLFEMDEEVTIQNPPKEPLDGTAG